MGKKRILILCGVFVLSIMFLTASAYAIGTPTIISPKVPFGRSCYTYHASRTPTFSWTAVPGATWYRIFVSEKDTPMTAVLDQWVEAGTSWTPGSDDALTPGTRYIWWVRAWNSTEGFGSWSVEANFTAGRYRTMVINANAFVPHYDGYAGTYYKGGAALHPNDSSSSSWNAPVTLPKGAVVQGVWFYYYNDTVTSTASQAGLRRSAYNSINIQNMASMTATTDIGDNHVSDTSIDYATINSLYSYFVWVYLPSPSNYLIHVSIHYWY